jgi:hypothetical protein
MSVPPPLGSGGGGPSQQQQQQQQQQQDLSRMISMYLPGDAAAAAAGDVNAQSRIQQMYGHYGALMSGPPHHHHHHGGHSPDPMQGMPPGSSAYPV